MIGGLNLFAALGVEELDDAALFEMFVLPKFETFDISRRQAALEQLRCHWPQVKSKYEQPNLCDLNSQIQRRTNLVDKLRELAFVEVGEHLYRPNELFDPSNR